MRWLREHSLRAHLLGPIWARIPERLRWRIVAMLNRSQRYCWCDLVDAALCHHDDDACDIAIPYVDSDAYCRTVCDWSHPDHAGEHDCSCYCAKFQFRATEGAIDRPTSAASPGATTGGDE